MIFILPQTLLLFSVLYAMAVGAFLGAVYDIFRIIRIAMFGSPKNGELLSSSAWRPVQVAAEVIIFFQDLIYAMIAAIFITVFVFHVNDGQIRYFMLLGACTGFALYYFTVGRLVIYCADAIIRFIKYLLHLLYSVTAVPIFYAGKFICRLVYRFLVFLCHKFYTTAAIRQLYKDAASGFKRQYGKTEG